MMRINTLGLPDCSPLPPVIQTSLMWFRPFEYLTQRTRRCETPFAVRVTSRPPLIFMRAPQEIASVFGARGYVASRRRWCCRLPNSR